jgi:uncharacterized membrane protein YhaH (DUF805 family)
MDWGFLTGEKDGAIAAPQHMAAPLAEARARGKLSGNSFAISWQLCCLQTRDQVGRGIAMEWMLMPYKRYAEFSGWSRRKEYWMFYLFFMVVYVVLAVIMSMGAPTLDPMTGEMSGGGAMMTIGGGLLGLFMLGSIIPSIAVSVRRMHDQDRSGWWILCPILNFVFLFFDGTRGDNRFGPDPKAGES